MGKVTDEYLIEKIVKKSKLQPRKKGETDDEYLNRLTHLHLESQSIDEIKLISEYQSVIVLYLQNNSLEKIDSLEKFPNLTHLYLQRNRISRMENLNDLKSLQKLYVGWNMITVIEGLNELSELTELHVENQVLAKGETLIFDPRSLQNLSRSLKVLNISNNKIKTIRFLSQLEKLTTLTAKNNQLDDIDDVADTLSRLLVLKNLNLIGNPIASDRKYRDGVICSSKSLKTLDDKDIDETSRIFIENLNFNKESRSRLSKRSTVKSFQDCPENFLRFATFSDPNEVLKSCSSGQLGSKLFPAYKHYVDKNPRIKRLPIGRKMVKDTEKFEKIVRNTLLRMDNYRKGKRTEDVIDRNKIPIPDLPADFVWMQVSDGSKMRNLLTYAMKALDEEKPVVWTGVGQSLGKAISCAEILKRKYKVHQISKICYTKVEDHWDPCIRDLETLIVRRDIPTIHILLSRQMVNTSEPGYQAPGKYNSFWKSSTSQSTNRSRPEHSRQANERAQLLKEFTGKDK